MRLLTSSDINNEENCNYVGMWEDKVGINAIIANFVCM